MVIVEWLVGSVITADIFDHHAEQIIMVVDKYFAIFDGIMRKYDSTRHQKEAYG